MKTNRELIEEELSKYLEQKDKADELGIEGMHDGIYWDAEGYYEDLQEQEDDDDEDLADMLKDIIKQVKCVAMIIEGTEGLDYTYS